MLKLPIIGLFLVISCVAFGAGTSQRRVIPFDEDWRFMGGDVKAATEVQLDDTAWRTVRVPHDWSIAGPFDKENPSGPSGALLPGGIGWYRKHFVLPVTQAGMRVFVDFDGVRENSDVWVNGFHLGHRPNGYVGLHYELTEHVSFDGKTDNILAVRADNSGEPEARWAAGAGIDRHVRLTLVSALHIEHGSTFVSTTGGTVHFASAVSNQTASGQSVAMEIAIIAPDGKVAAVAKLPPQMMAASVVTPLSTDSQVMRPQLWDLESPKVYTARLRLISNGKTLDEEETHFGFRDARFEAQTGFWLNGKNFKIKGVCLHENGGAFGSAIPLGVWRRRLAALKTIGVNAIRTAHNPPSPEFLDLCDEMGFLVMDELFDCWTVAKRPYDYHLYFNEWAETDLKDTVMRDRNHPSIILYSAGNEIHDTPKADLAKGILARLITAFHAADPTRPVTQALFRPNASHDYDNGLADMLDVVGQNYREPEILAAHAAKPSRRILGTENGHGLKIWLAMRDNPPYAGQFLWVGIDYLGESPGWPSLGEDSGLLDRTGSFKPRGWERQSWWASHSVVHVVRRTAPTAATPTDPGYEKLRARQAPVLFHDWTPSDLSRHAEDVEVYSNCQTVDLLLNGKSLGRQSKHADDSARTWKVSFASGSLKAVCADGVTDELRTAGAPSRLVITTDEQALTPNWDDVAFLRTKIVDSNGVVVPGATHEVAFEVVGPGEIAAVDNADLFSHESFQGSRRSAYNGMVLAIVRANKEAGVITVKASAQGLTGASARISVK